MKKNNIPLCNPLNSFAGKLTARWLFIDHRDPCTIILVSKKELIPRAFIRTYLQGAACKNNANRRRQIYCAFFMDAICVARCQGVAIREPPRGALRVITDLYASMGNLTLSQMDHRLFLSFPEI